MESFKKILKKEIKSTPAADKAKIILATAGGGYVGSSMGIAALGTACSGMLPVAILCGAGAYGFTKYYRMKKDLQAEKEKSAQ